MPDDVGIEEYPTSPSGARRGRAWWLVAAGALVAVGVLLIGVVVTRQDDTTPGAGQPRPLAIGGTTAGAAADAARYPWPGYRYELGTTLPDLGTTATVYQLSAPAPTTADVDALAVAFGVTGAAVATDYGGWVVEDDAHTLSVNVDAGGWRISYGPTFSAVGGSVDASAGVGSAGVGSAGVGSAGAGTTTDGGAPNASDVPEATTTIEPELTAPPATTVTPAPADLPDAAAAEAIARDLLGRADLLPGEWSAKVVDASGPQVAYACAEGTPCPAPPVPTVTGRLVELRRVVDDTPVEAYAWTVEVGDGGAIVYASGIRADLVPVADYPLEPVAAAYQRLVDGDADGPTPQPLGAAAPAIDSGTAVAPATTTTFTGGEDGSTPGAPAPMPPEPVPTEPGSTEPGSTEPVETAPPMVVTVTGAELSRTVAAAFEGGATVYYVVPAYRFVGHLADGTAWETTVVAIDPAFVAPAEWPTPDTSAVLPPDVGPTEPVTPPQSAPGVTSGGGGSR